MDRTFAKDIVSRAIKKGCGAAEVFIKRSKGISVAVKGGGVEALEASQDYGIAIRVISGHKLGFAFATSPEEIDRAISDAVENSRWTAADEFIDIPENSVADEVQVFDENIRNVKEDDLIANALALEERALSFDARIKKVRKAEISAATGTTSIANSRGISVAYESTYCSAYVTTLAQGADGESQMGWDFTGSRRISDINVRSIGENAAKRAIELLGSRKIAPVKVPVVLNPSVAVDFLEILSASLSAEAVQKKRSFLTDKVGRSVVSEKIDIIDDGTMPWGTGTRPVDDEGVAVTSKSMISSGILNGYLHNTYTAGKAGTRSTGNASRGGYKSLPGVSVTNFYLRSADNKPQDDLIRSLPKGILIVGAMGIHTANPISGDFSIGISGLWIEHGEIAYPVKEAVISGNILDMFRKIEAVGNDLKFYGSSGSPSILIGNMDISA